MIDYNLYKKKSQQNKPNNISFIEQEISSRLLDKLSFIHLAPINILDLGCGINSLNSQLLKKYPNSNVTNLDLSINKIIKTPQAICANFNNPLPFANNSFDLIISNLVVHNCMNFYNLFIEILRILAPKGMFIFSTFGSDTLKEVQQSWRQIDKFKHIMPFVDLLTLGNLLQESGLAYPVMDTEKLTLEYNDVNSAIKDIRSIDEHLALEDMKKQFTSKKHWAAFTHLWKNDFQNDLGKIPCTYDIIYGHAIKPKISKQKPIENSEIHISLENLKTQLKGKNS